jgi:dephospho-CoA kinase
MPAIGITGGLATGKSLVAGLLRERGAVTFSADEAARAVVAPGSPILRRIAATFGPEYLLPDGSLDRAKLGARVFDDPDARHTLESLTHPPILEHLRSQMDAARRAGPPDAVIAVEVPLLFEAGMEDWFDKVVVVACSERAQVARLAARDGLSAEEARRRIAAQMPLAEKIARADYVVWNEAAKEEIRSQVAKLWDEWTRRATARPDERL